MGRWFAMDGVRGGCGPLEQDGGNGDKVRLATGSDPENAANRASKPCAENAARTAALVRLRPAYRAALTRYLTSLGSSMATNSW